ncbi:MAG: hypothetical protein QOI36_6590 [Pseudonocardiales bacterium]|nr:hypothetical protein [Pseudonocardiales bacterium]
MRGGAQAVVSVGQDPLVRQPLLSGLGLVFVPGALVNFLNWRITVVVVETHRTDGQVWAPPSLGRLWMERRLRSRP